MYTLELGVLMYKYSINDLPVAFNEYFMKSFDIHDYPTRHVNNLNLTNNRKSVSDHAIRTNGPILWNSLSETIRESKSVNISVINLNQISLKHMRNFEFLSTLCLIPSLVLCFVVRLFLFLLYVNCFCLVIFVFKGTSVFSWECSGLPRLLQL